MMNFDTPINRIGTHSLKWNIPEDSDIIPLWVADMDFAVAPAIQQAIIQRAQHPIFGYVCPPEAFYEATINWFSRRHGWEINRNWFIYTTGVVPAIAAIIKALTKPGDKVLLQTPDYNAFFTCIHNNDCIIEQNPLKAVGNTYVMDYEDLDKKVADPNVKLLLLCNPHNPTGRVWKREELEQVAHICQRHNVIVVSDEIHCEITMPGYQYTPFGTVTNNYVACVSPSKSFNIAGLQTANIITPRDDWRALIDRAINDNEVCDINPFGVEALMAAYNHSEDWITEMCEYVWGNYLLIKDFCENLHPQWKLTKMEGSYLAWIDVRATGKNGDEVAKEILDKAHVWVNSGTMYGTYYPHGTHHNKHNAQPLNPNTGEGFIRINLATNRARLQEALHRIHTAINP